MITAAAPIVLSKVVDYGLSKSNIPSSIAKTVSSAIHFGSRALTGGLWSATCSFFGGLAGGILGGQAEKAVARASLSKNLREKLAELLAKLKTKVWSLLDATMQHERDNALMTLSRLYKKLCELELETRKTTPTLAHYRYLKHIEKRFAMLQINWNNLEHSLNQGDKQSSYCRD